MIYKKKVSCQIFKEQCTDKIRKQFFSLGPDPTHSREGGVWACMRLPIEPLAGKVTC